MDRNTTHQLAMTDVHDEGTGQRRAIGVIGTAARSIVGLVLVGSVVYGQFSSHLIPIAWALGLVGFPALVLAWHGWRVRRKPAPFRDTSPLSFVLSVALPLALYFTWWYAPALSVTSDAALLFVSASMLLAALRASSGCEVLALSNWLLHRSDQIERPDRLRRLHAYRRVGPATPSSEDAQGRCATTDGIASAALTVSPWHDRSPHWLRPWRVHNVTSAPPGAFSSANRLKLAGAE